MHLEDVVGLHALGRFGLQDHLPGAAEFVEVVDAIAAESGLQRGEDVVDTDAQRRGSLAVDVEPDQRGRGAIGGEDAGQGRIRVRRLHDAAGDRRHLARRRPGKGLQLVIKPGAGAETDNRRQVERDHDRRRQFQKIRAQTVEDAPHALGLCHAVRERRRGSTKNVALFDLIDAVDQAVADDRGDRRHPRRCLGDFARHRPATAPVRFSDAPSGSCASINSAP